MTDDERAETAADVVRALRQTWPWAGFVGVMATLGVIFEFGMGLVMLAGGGMVPRQADPFGIYRWLGPVYIGLALVYVVPTFLILRIAWKSLRASEEDPLSVVGAVRALRDWWIGTGVLAILMLIAMCGGMFAAVVAGVVLAGRM